MRRAQESRLFQWIQQDRPKPLVMRGARQVGKSTLVRQFAAKRGLKLYEVNLENHPEMEAVFAKRDLKQIIHALEAICDRQFEPASSLVFFDEIQAIPNALSALRLFFDKPSPYVPVIAAGSLLDLFLESFPDSMPVGRIEYLHMGPMNFIEFLTATGQTVLEQQLGSYRIGDTINAATHHKLLQALREFMVVGGMPEAVHLFAQTKSLKQVQATQQFIVDTYRDDFFKYKNRVNARTISLLRQVYRYVPSHVGEKIKFVRISGDEKAQCIKEAIDLLALARVIHKVLHSHGSALPLAAQVDEKTYKCLFLDIGLMNRVCEMDWASLAQLSDTRLINEEGIAEQLVGQELLLDESGVFPPQLHYWQREAKSSAAEVDYVLSFGRDIVPIEVKAGAAGSMKSLHRFMLEKSHNWAIRFDLNPPSRQKVTTTIDGQKIEYDLWSLPLYLACRLRSQLY